MQLFAVLVALALIQEPPTPKALTATVTGQVLLEGKRPELKPLAIRSDQAQWCCAEGETVDGQDRSLLIAERGGVANVVVEIHREGVSSKALTEIVPVEISRCRFEQRVTLVPVGTTVAFFNRDRVGHNGHLHAVENATSGSGWPAGKGRTWGAHCIAHANAYLCAP